MPVTPDAGPHLRAAGHDAIHAVDLGLARSSDDELLTVARREERVIITADLDYPRLIALQQADRPGIILFRGGAYSDREMLALLDRVLTRAPPHSASNTQSLSSIASASVAAPCLSASNRQCQSAGPVRGLDYPQNGGRIHPTPEPDDERPGRNVCFSTVPLLVNAEDQIRQTSTPIQREFPGHVVGCPEAHDLQEPVACWIGATPQGKVGEDQRAPGRYRLRLANHIPCRCQLSELTSEALFQVAVVSARRAGRKDRITRPELQGEAAPAQDAFRLKPEAWTPCKQRHEFTERQSIEPGVAKQRERSREFQRSVGRTRPFDAFAA